MRFVLIICLFYTPESLIVDCKTYFANLSNSNLTFALREFEVNGLSMQKNVEFLNRFTG